MDYTKQPVLFKIRKVLRYVSLYGISRTLMKVRGQYHVKRTYVELPAPRPRGRGPRTVGIIGCGNFAFSNIAYYLDRHVPGSIKGCMDVDINRAASLCLAFGGEFYTTDPQRIMSDPDIDLVYIASNHASHAEYAIDAMRAGKSVHIEKPHVVSRDQLIRLCCAMRDTSQLVRLGYNRPISPIGKAVRLAVSNNSGPMVMNWFVAGHEIPKDHWYFAEEEGGRILGNLCHWIDFLMQLVPRERRYPVKIVPVRKESSDCNIAVGYIFADGSVGAITFSAMGHTFEGVRERFAAHAGDVLLRMDDFQRLVVEVGERRTITSSRLRDHGHRDAIIGSYVASRGQEQPADGRAGDVAYVWETGDLMLATKRALESGEEATVREFRSSEL